VSTNGRILAALMEQLYDGWPLPIERLVMIGHSMGGLVARSAVHHGALIQRNALRWPGRLNDLVCLGAPLERAGHGIDRLLEALPCAAPLARLGKLRSAGIHDLRQGNIVNVPTSQLGSHDFTLVPMPEQTRCHAVAACLGPSGSHLRSRLLGDGLVPIASALGEHEDPARGLAFDSSRQAVVHECGYLDLLSSPAVFERLRHWLN
jgi:pimeloyl-ACP methyl ester carboxylesterase